MTTCILKYSFWRNSDFIKYNTENTYNLLKICKCKIVILHMQIVAIFFHQK